MQTLLRGPSWVFGGNDEEQNERVISNLVFPV